MKHVALITGASSGIGLELARIHASNSGDLVLAARNAQKLDELKKELESGFGVKVVCIPSDLSEPSAAEKLVEEIKRKNITIDILINNAGFGDFGFFHEAEWKKIRQMIDLNVMTLTHLTHLLLPGMVSRRRGRILNVASTAAFQPGPLMAVYYATKAYVLNFSEALGNELKEHGITVTALCPGATESGFQAAAQMEESRLVKGRKLPSSAEVAAYGYKSMMKGRAVAIHGWMNAVMANAVRFVPRSWIVKIARQVQERTK